MLGPPNLIEIGVTICNKWKVKKENTKTRTKKLSNLTSK